MILKRLKTAAIVFAIAVAAIIAVVIGTIIGTVLVFLGAVTWVAFLLYVLYMGIIEEKKERES